MNTSHLPDGEHHSVLREGRGAPALCLLAAIISLILAATLLTTLLAAPAQAVTFEQTRLTTNAFSEGIPLVDKGRLAWLAEDEEGWGVYLWDSLWGPAGVRKISSQGDMWGLLALAGDLVVWTTHDPGPYAIKVRHILSGQEHTIAFPAWDSSEVSTDGRYVVWLDKANALSPSQVYLYDSSTGQTRQLTSDLREKFRCGVDSGYVVWEEESTSDPANRVDILVYDTRNKQTTLLTTAALRYRGEAFDAGRVVWLQHDFTHADIAIHDLTSGETNLVVATPTSKSFFDLCKDKLVWSDGWNESFEIAVADLDNQLPTSPVILTNNTASDVFAQTDGRYVAWDYRPASGDEVRVADTESNAIVSLGRGLMAARSGLSEGRVAWMSGTFPDTEVWTAVFPLFDDVAIGTWYFEAIQGLAERNLVAGYPKTTGGADFRPDNNLLRAQFAKMICGALRLSVFENMALPPFTDLGPNTPDNLYPHEYVAAAYSAGITTGTTATTFSPYVSVTRAQAVSMACRGVQNLYPGLLASPPASYTGSLGNFSSAHQANMQIFEFNGLLAGLPGYGPGWNPWAPASRAELAEILWEVMKMIAETW